MSERVLFIEEGRIRNPADIRKQFTELRDGIYLVKISTRKRRGLKQNAYYWGVVCEMVRDGLKDAGYRCINTTDDAHEVTKSLFLKHRLVNEETGEVIETIGSTATLTTIEFNQYIEEIIQWAAEYLSIQIPLPNELI
jgi:hypothetical protein